jgi:hypothetical protein
MESETLRAFLIQYLKSFFGPNQREDLQWEHCYSGVSRLVSERKPEHIGSGQKLREEDAALLKHLVWDLILERVLTPGTREPRSVNGGWPFLSITAHGKKVISEQKAVPYDPDGYLKELTKSVPSMNPAVVDYVAESVGTFRTGNNLAAAVMLGAASEMVFDELSVALPPTLSDSTKRAKLADKMQKGKMLMGALSPASSPMKLIVPLTLTARSERFRFSPPTTSIT